MKRIFEFILASILGGVITISGYFILIKEKTTQSVVLTQNENPSEAKQVQVNQKAETFASNLNFTYAAEKTVHAVVHVKVRSQYAGYDNPFYNFLFGKPNYQVEPAPIVSAGSGVIISNDGYIVTNNHVIEGADMLEVTLNDKRTYTAQVIGADPTTDIALIKINEKDLPYLDWGNSDDLKVGEWVLAVGNPFNLASTVTAGIVSAKARSINILNKSTAIEAFIQTDAAVNPGNSGGALVDTDGKLVGINTAIASPTGAFSGYSFAVPQKLAQKIVNDLLEYGTVQRAFIGVSIAEVTSPIAKQNGVTSTKGVYVSDVASGGAAADAGIRGGDVILKIKDAEVNSTSELQEQIGQYRPGDQINVTILRGDKDKTVLLTLRNIEGKTDIVKADEIFELFGTKFKTIPATDANKLRIKGGVQVVSVGEGKFRSAGIKEGFIITSVNRRGIYDLQDFRLVFNNLEGGIYIEGVYPNGISAYYAFGI
ncbi:MAG: deoxyribonuclease HsdR [Bacteroidetes bacterium GWA2_40_14]|jgi:Do/DeqQ family serine protease|nr:MAG: deoxyribonuclease HsdR [Bacteroidetes bacterium GWA2_40_14]HAZ02416.1 deoxyribonuclease HsdR [Marinilabiliales bacterium]